MAGNARRDQNFVPTLLGVSSTDAETPIAVYADPTTHRLLVDATGSATSFQKDVFTSTNGQTTFTPSQTVSVDIYFSLNGAIQTPSTDYSIVGGDYVLNSAIPSGVAVILFYTY